MATIVQKELKLVGTTDAGQHWRALFQRRLLPASPLVMICMVVSRSYQLKSFEVQKAEKHGSKLGVPLPKENNNPLRGAFSKQAPV